jgi:hypothetical protein
MRRFLATAAVMAFSLAGISACGDDGDGGGSADCTNDADPKIVKIRFADGDVTPSGDRVEVEVCQQVQFIVAADEAGEIHIHSDPEQELAYEEGEKKYDVAFDKPGVIEVESHDLDQVIVQLEVK